MTFQRLLKAVRERSQCNQPKPPHLSNYLDADAPLSYLRSVPPRPSDQSALNHGQIPSSPTPAQPKQDGRALNQSFDPSPSLRALIERLPDLSYMLTDKLCIE
ncbi:hypothetical protein H4R35_007421, partial [Dimargaris xerosporica]